MATAAVSPAYAHAGEASNSGLWSWLTTVDHKRIGVLYMYTALACFVLGGTRSADHALAAAGTERHVGVGRDVQPAVHDARHDDDLPRRHAAVGGVLQFPDSAADRRARRRVPAAQRVQLLGLSVRLAVHELVVARRRWRRTAAGSATRRSRRCRTRRA